MGVPVQKSVHERQPAEELAARILLAVCEAVAMPRTAQTEADRDWIQRRAHDLLIDRRADGDSQFGYLAAVTRARQEWVATRIKDARGEGEIPF